MFSSSNLAKGFRSALKRPSIYAPLNRRFVKETTWGSLRVQQRAFLLKLTDDPEGDAPAPIYATPDRVKEHLPRVCRRIGELHGDRIAAAA